MTDRLKTSDNRQTASDASTKNIGLKKYKNLENISKKLKYDTSASGVQPDFSDLL
jgi:hypothetical protein